LYLKNLSLHEKLLIKSIPSRYRL